MTQRKRITRSLTFVVLASMVIAGLWLVRQEREKPKTITAYFASAVGIYTGDEVRVAGVKVGTVLDTQPEGARAKLTLSLQRDVPVPADARAVIVAQNLVSARYVQLAAKPSPGVGVIADGASIPIERTAVPVEWDQVKEQLNRLATELAPKDGAPSSSLARFIDSSASAMDGKGAALHDTLTQLSSLGRLLAAKGGNIVDVITNLQKFIGALSQSNQQVMQFQDRLATLTSVLDGSKSNLDAALKNLSEAVVTVQEFVADTRDRADEQVKRLASVTQILVDKRMDVEQVLHVAPNAIANTYNMFDPQLGTATGVFTLANLANPVQFLCGSIGAMGNVTAPETAKLCAQYLGPALRTMNFNAIPIPVNPFLAKTPAPDQLIYTDPKLMPGAQQASPTDLPASAPPVAASVDMPHSLPEMLMPGPSAPSTDANNPPAALPAEQGAR